MSRRVNTDKVIFNKFVFLVILLFFVVVIYRVAFLSLSKEIDGVNLGVFAENRNTRKDTIFAERGAIYDKDGNVLAQTINSYTVVAVLSPNSSNHILDKEKTAKELSEIINMSKESILTLLNRNVYQVELGPGGRGITELTKEKIEDLELPGITFISSYKRYYPNGNFASYVLGYTQAKENGNIIGEMGIESYYNDMLKGKNGSVEYQQDLNGYRIPNTPEIKKNSVDGADIYLTIDSNIEFFAERAVREAYELYGPEWLVAVVADAKTGAILASTSYPSFDPNVKDIKNYLNPLVTYAFEPGSTMKTFTYMAVMEKGNYNAEDTFKSGTLNFEGNLKVTDWMPQGWGTINYDQGYKFSANTGIASLTKNYITGPELRSYYEKLGFGKNTGITLPGEVSGKIKFKYPIEIANAGYGQGITTTPIQHIQALTSIANSGIELKPYIVDKIVDSKTGETLFDGKREELGRVASTSTIDKMKKLMYDVIYEDSPWSTGASFRIPGYDILGKTGTAQYANPATGKYYLDDIHYIRSFEGMFPKDDPEVILYIAAKNPIGGNSANARIAKSLMKDIANSRGLFTKQGEDASIKSYTLPNLLNKNLEDANKILKDYTDKVVIIGDGNKVINEYPASGSKVNSLDVIFLVTNGNKIQIPSLKGWSLKEVQTLCDLINIKLEYEGNGFVYEQDLTGDLGSNKTLKVKLQSDIKEEEIKEDTA